MQQLVSGILLALISFYLVRLLIVVIEDELYDQICCKADNMFALRCPVLSKWNTIRHENSGARPKWRR